jgi:hypothetical protein
VDVAVDDAVRVAVGGAVDVAVRVAVDDAVRGAVGVAVRDAVGGAVGGAVRGAVDVAVRVAVDDAVDRVISQAWYRILGGQFWVGWWYGPASVSFFREVCGLDLGKDMSARADAYAGTCESACWWWPHRDFVMVCERPSALRRDARGRLHCETGPAIAWPDGWSLYRLHGVRVTREDIEGALTATRIRDEPNAEVRRVLVDRYGPAKYMADVGAVLVHTDRYGSLYRVEMPGDEPIEMVKVRNSTPEPDGSIKDYWLRVAPGAKTAHAAVASTFRNPITGKRLTAREYQPRVET